MSSAGKSFSEPPAPDRLGPAIPVSLAGEVHDDVDEAATSGRRSLLRRVIGPLRGYPLVGASIAAGILLALTATLAWISTDASPTRSSPRAAARVVPAAAAEASVTAPDSPSDPAFRLQDLTPSEAEIYNTSIPISSEPHPPARPFHLDDSNPQDELRATDCLTAAVYYEAASEPLEGQQAVAQVVLNRLRDPHYPKTVCGVVFQGVELPTGWQFTFVGDGSLARKPSPQGWAVAHEVAVAALHGFVAKAVGEATHYHTVWVAPYWSPTLLKVANIGAHIFYRWAGGMGLPRAFSGQYTGGEPLLAQITALDPAVMNLELPAAPEANKIVFVDAPRLQPPPQIGSATETADNSAAAKDATAAAPAASAAAATAPVMKMTTALPEVQTRPPPPKDNRPRWSTLPTGSGFSVK